MITLKNKILNLMYKYFKKSKTETWYLRFNELRKKSEIEDSLAIRLKQTARNNAEVKLKIAVLCHLFYIDLWPEIRQYLKNIEMPFDLYINLVKESASIAELEAVKYEIEGFHPGAVIIISENRGLDIGGTLKLIQVVSDNKREYDLFLKIHTKKSKKSTTKEVGRRWRLELLNSLLGSPYIVNGIVTLFRENENIGMIGPKTWLIKAKDDFHFAVGINEPGIHEICRKFNIKKDIHDLEFIGGTMFWIDARVIADKLKSLDINSIVNNMEPGYFIDNRMSTITHSLERVFGLMILESGKEIVTI